MMPAGRLSAGLVLAGVGVVVCVVVLGWFCYRLLTERGHLLLRLQEAERGRSPRSPSGLRPGSYLADFALPRPDGSMATLSGLIGRPLLLVFAREACLFSRMLIRELRVAGDTSGGPLPVLGQQNREVARAFGTLETPAAYLIDAEGTIAAGPAIGAEAVLMLVAGRFAVSGGS